MSFISFLQPRTGAGLVAAALIASLGLAASPIAQAADFPDRPLTVVVGYAAGGATDILARLVSKALSDELGQPVVVENRAGANSNIGADYVSRASKDGYTIYVGTIANTINRALYKDLRYDFLKDFEFVGMMASIANVLVVNPERPYKTVSEYIDYAKAHPGKVTCASSGTGSSIHMSCELFKIRTGTDILHIPYRGSGPAVVDLLAGQVDSMFDNLPSSIAHIKAGKLRAIATTTAQRVGNLPDTPTFVENGLKDFVVQSWFGLVVPAGTPADVVSTLNQALNRALAQPDVVQAYEKNGFQKPAAPNSPESFRAHATAEVAQWAEVVEQGKITVE